MAETPSSSHSPSRSSTPNNNRRFLSQSHTAEDLLKEQTVGLVHLSDFRKRRAEALEQSGKGSRDGTPVASGASTPDGREPAANKPLFKKRKKVVKKGGLSFGNGDEEDDEEQNGQAGNASTASRSDTPAQEDSDAPSSDTPTLKKKGLKPNSSIPLAPKAKTKPALLREAQLKESLRKEYIQIQNAVKETEIIIPFVFFDGKNSTGGKCRVKKGDMMWLFLERARKVGADMAMAGKGDVAGSKRDWARIGVDDLMVVVGGEIVVPHHYDFHHFILNRTTGYDGTPLFPYSPDPTPATSKHLLPTSSTNDRANTPDEANNSSTTNNNHLQTASSLAQQREATRIADAELEGFNHDPARTKVVDRRWYERHKHIYPASIWEEFDPGRDYSKGGGGGGPRRTDGQGNAFFFS